MKSKLILLFFIIALAALAYFGYPIIKNRYFTNGPKSIQNEVGNSKFNQEMNLETMPDQESQSPEGELKNNILNITVTPSDCDNECSKFQKKEELQYCRHACGLQDINQEGAIIQPPTDCSTVSGLEKDYCLKDLAIKNKDFKVCDKINDSGIKKTCKDRLTEVIIESQ